MKRPLPGAKVRLLGRWTNRATQTDRGGRYAFTGIPQYVDLELEVVTPRGRSILNTFRAEQTEAPMTLDVTLPKR